MGINVGDYVRYVRGAINGYVPPRISKIQEIESEFCIKLDNNQVVMTNDVIKSSQDIIGLIEVGDYVNGYKIVDLGKKTIDGDYTKGTPVIFYLTNPNTYNSFTNDKIKSIVTKEQFQSMQYEVKNEDSK